MAQAHCGSPILWRIARVLAAVLVFAVVSTPATPSAPSKGLRIGCAREVPNAAVGGVMSRRDRNVPQHLLVVRCSSRTCSSTRSRVRFAMKFY
jgi:hypothetical protein